MKIPMVKMINSLKSQVNLFFSIVLQSNEIMHVNKKTT